jgi:Fic family protein
MKKGYKSKLAKQEKNLHIPLDTFIQAHLGRGWKGLLISTTHRLSARNFILSAAILIYEVVEAHPFQDGN